MRKGIGMACVILGLLCLLAAVGFVLYNSNEVENGQQYAQTILRDVQEKMAEAPVTEPSRPEHNREETPAATEETGPREMPTVPVEGYESIGILSIPVLEMELPVLKDWSYEKLKKAPCHYFGSYYEPNFVIAGHNYTSHFGRIADLQPGDLVLFTDVTGTVHYYEVVLLETLTPTATQEMITSGFDFSLYTCTPGGGSRVTVRCKAVL